MKLVISTCDVCREGDKWVHFNVYVQLLINPVVKEKKSKVSLCSVVFGGYAISVNPTLLYSNEGEEGEGDS